MKPFIPKLQQTKNYQNKILPLPQERENNPLEREKKSFKSTGLEQISCKLLDAPNIIPSSHKNIN